MQFERNFRFLNQQLNSLFIHQMLESGLKRNLDDNGIVYFNSVDEEAVEIILAKIRDSWFDTWQILSCPADWVNKYRQEMKRLNVPFTEELNDGQVEFLIPESCNPHDWQCPSAG